MKSLKNISIKGKTVLVRVDFNVSLNEKGEIEDDLRLKETLPTIFYLCQKEAKVILISHFREGIIDSIRKKLSSLLQKEIKIEEDCIGESVQNKIKEMKKGEVLLLGNIRKYKEEKENSPVFGKKLAELADLFVNDAFSVSHREHASVVQVPSFVCSVPGILMEKEIGILNKVSEKPRRPIVVVIGGAKAESKSLAIDYFLNYADCVLLGGKIANKAIEERKFFSPKLCLPEDFIVSKDMKNTEEVLLSEIKNFDNAFDIGNKTINLYGDILSQARTIIWAGPLGFFEKKPFSLGTKQIAKFIVENEEALKVSGGGDTNYALQIFGFREKMDLVSCGGGAMLAYLTKKRMPGLEALRG